MGDQANEGRAQQIFEKCNSIEQQFGDHFTGKFFACNHHFIERFSSSVIIEEDNLEDVYNRICEIIDDEQNVPFVWMPSKDKI